MYSISQYALRPGVCTRTIRRWDARGLIHCRRTPGNHRRIAPAEVDRLLVVMHKSVRDRPGTKHCAIYARVSGHRQKTDGDLDRQLKTLTLEWRTRFRSSPMVFSDIGSGLNLRRRALQRLLRTAKAGLLHTVLITHRDRLARFGVDLIEQLLTDHGAYVITTIEQGT